VTLSHLLTKYHDSRKAGTWSSGHKRDQERARKFWLEAFGDDRPCHAITADEIETVAQARASQDGWTVRTHRKYLKYLRAAGRFGRRKAGLFPDLNVDPWASVDLPTEGQAPRERPVDSAEMVYAPEQVAKLCRTDPGVDWRVTLAANIAADTDRRIGSIRFLRTADVTVQPGRVWLTFAGASDKGRKASEVPVTADTFNLVLQALERPEVQAHGWLLPGGREGKLRGSSAHWGGFDITGSAGPIRKLHDAEDKLGIPRVKGRAYHGLKRAHVSASYEEAGGDETKVQRLTGNSSASVLRKHYRKHETGATEAHQDRIRARFSGGSHTEAIPSKTGSA
jgi:integrase